MRRIGLWASVAVGAVAFLLLIPGQLVLPWVAERMAVSALEDRSEGIEVEVRAFPAVKLLFGRADEVRLRIDRYESGEGELADSIARARRVGELDVEVSEMRIRLLTVRDVRVTKDGDVLAARATLRDEDLDRALPARVRVSPVAAREDAGGREIVLEGRVELFGISASSRARVEATRGRLVVSPDVPLVGSLVGLVLFEDDRLMVERIEAEHEPGGFGVSVTGRYAE